MKAWMVGSDPSWSALVFAETRNKARQLFISQYPGSYEPEYIEVEATRVPEMDPFAPADAMVALENDDLPPGAPDYWTETEDDEDV